jgi:radical SAM protein with 4Fe4S-binding SPASM domain
MPINLPVISNPTAPSNPKRLLARGTKTAQVENRQIRLHAPGDRPWEKSPDNHRDEVNIEQHGDVYIAFKPSTGALSAFRLHEYMCFNVFIAANGDVEAVTRYLLQTGVPADDAARRAAALGERFVREGWMRTELPTPPTSPLLSAYLTVTRWCDLTCPYCYQGLNNRANTEMTFDQVQLVLDRIQAVNPRCQITLSGGEPFSHSRFHDILDLVEERGMPMAILSNGTYIDEKAADHLRSLTGLKYIQISLDGITAETHEFTRGKGHFPKAMAAIQNVIDRKLPFKLAPTLHNKNMHEMPAIAALAIGNGGWVSPNPLKELPHAGLNYTNLAMSNEKMLDVLHDTNLHLVKTFGVERVVEVGRRFQSSDPEVCSVMQPNSRFICGMAYSLVDIDWNGDVYPCHLSKGPELVIGNVLKEDFASIFKHVEERGIRVKSNEIEKCSGCKFVSTCAGGCRAGAWFTYGTLEHEDEMCEDTYPAKLQRLLVGARLMA